MASPRRCAVVSNFALAVERARKKPVLTLDKSQSTQSTVIGISDCYHTAGSDLLPFRNLPHLGFKEVVLVSYNNTTRVRRWSHVLDQHHADDDRRREEEVVDRWGHNGTDIRRWLLEATSATKTAAYALFQDLQYMLKIMKVVCVPCWLRRL